MPHVGATTVYICDLSDLCAATIVKELRVPHPDDMNAFIVAAALKLVKEGKGAFEYDAICIDNRTIWHDYAASNTVEYVDPTAEEG